MTSRYVLLSACKAATSGYSKGSAWLRKKYSRNFCVSSFPSSSWSSSSSPFPSSSSARSFSTSPDGVNGEEEEEREESTAMGITKDKVGDKKRHGKADQKFTPVKLKDKRYIVQSQRARNSDLEAKAEASGLGWREVAACVLHRYPVITPDPEPWEIEMWDLQEKMNALRREHFIKQIGEGHPMMIPEKNPTEEEILASLPFKPASRITEADEKDDRRSLERKLQDSLFLIVKRNREENAWQFPQGKLRENETLRSAAERIIDRAAGKTRRWFISNAPIGHYCYEYPENVQKTRNQFGAKVFFYRAQILGESIKLETRLYTDYAWISRNEAEQYFNVESTDFMNHLLLD